MPPTPREWVLVVPVKPLARAKSRLAALDPGERERLVLAFAADTVRAALACPGIAAVVAVTDDPRVAGQLGRVGARAVPDSPGAGLNPALRHGAEAAAAAAPGAGVGALTADLPALRAGDLGAALEAARPHRLAFVADAPGTGTTLLLARTPADFAPAFGAGSRAAHLRAGAVELDLPDAVSLRRDVDTEADLRAALALGVGPRTAAVAGCAARVAGVQATVRSYDPATRSGTVLLDDGVELGYDGAAFDAGGMRLLRPGQRVRVRLSPDGAGVAFLTLATLPDPS